MFVLGEAQIVGFSTLFFFVVVLMNVATPISIMTPPSQ